MIEEYEFLHGYAIFRLLPGPILNIASYMDALLYDIAGRLVIINLYYITNSIDNVPFITVL